MSDKMPEYLKFDREEVYNAFNRPNQDEKEELEKAKEYMNLPIDFG